MACIFGTANASEVAADSSWSRGELETKKLRLPSVLAAEVLFNLPLSESPNLRQLGCTPYQQSWNSGQAMDVFGHFGGLCARPLYATDLFDEQETT
jgi:hypothetical protein